MSQEYISSGNISTQTPPEGVRIVDIPMSLPSETDSMMTPPIARHSSEIVPLPIIDTELMDEVDERIPEEIRSEFANEDKTIRTQLAEARTTIEGAKTETTKNVAELKEESEAAIARTQKAFERFEKKRANERDASKAEAKRQYDEVIAEATRQYKAFLAAADEQYGLGIAKKGMRARGYIAEQSRVIDAADAFIGETTLIAGKIENGIDVTVGLQTTHETARDNAVNAIDTDSDRRTELLIAIQKATRSYMEKVQARVEVERAERILHDKESGLLIAEDKERTRVLAPYEEYFIEKLGMEKGSERLNTALAEYAANNINQFEDLKEIIDTLKTYPKKFLENKARFDELNDDIAALKFKLEQYRIEYDHIPDKFAASNKIIRNEALVVSLAQKEYSANATAWAEAFAKLTTGDVNMTNKVPIPSQLVNLRQLKFDVYSAVRVVDKDDPFDGAEEPVLSPHIEAFLRLTPENREALIESAVRARMRNDTAEKIEVSKHTTGADLRGSVVDAGIVVGSMAMLGVRKFGRKFRYVKEAEVKE